MRSWISSVLSTRAASLMASPCQPGSRLIDRRMMRISWRAIFRTADAVDRAVIIVAPHSWVTCL
jgi:hypothetical protein